MLGHWLRIKFVASIKLPESLLTRSQVALVQRTWPWFYRQSSCKIPREGRTSSKGTHCTVSEQYNQSELERNSRNSYWYSMNAVGREVRFNNGVGSQGSSFAWPMDRSWWRHLPSFKVMSVNHNWFSSILFWSVIIEHDPRRLQQCELDLLSLSISLFGYLLCLSRER